MKAKKREEKTFKFEVLNWKRGQKMEKYWVVNNS
jgi:hypothetical protein